MNFKIATSKSNFLSPSDPVFISPSPFSESLTSDCVDYLSYAQWTELCLLSLFLPMLFTFWQSNVTLSWKASPPSVSHRSILMTGAPCPHRSFLCPLHFAPKWFRWENRGRPRVTSEPLGDPRLDKYAEPTLFSWVNPLSSREWIELCFNWLVTGTTAAKR